MTRHPFTRRIFRSRVQDTRLRKRFPLEKCSFAIFARKRYVQIRYGGCLVKVTDPERGLFLISGTMFGSIKQNERTEVKSQTTYK